MSINMDDSVESGKLFLERGALDRLELLLNR
jgi:hypothetical protein